jgi:hypothetical protein
MVVLPIPASPSNTKLAGFPQQMSRNLETASSSVARLIGGSATTAVAQLGRSIGGVQLADPMLARLSASGDQYAATWLWAASWFMIPRQFVYSKMYICCERR